MQHREAAQKMIRWARLAEEAATERPYREMRDVITSYTEMAQMWATVATELREGGEVPDGEDQQA